MKAHRMLLGFIAVAVVVVVGCSPDVPAETAVLTTATSAHTWSYEYLCEQGYPGYEGYCEDFGGGVDPCLRAVQNKNWNDVRTYCNLDAKITAFTQQFAQQVSDWISSHEKWISDENDRMVCDGIAMHSQNLVMSDRVREAAKNLLPFGALSQYGDWQHFPDELMAIISPHRVAQGVTAVASDIIHEVSHSVLGLLDMHTGSGVLDPNGTFDWGYDITVLPDGHTVGDTVDTWDRFCFNGFY